ncbi:MAG: hypothetical protein WC992_02360 [Acholeplasmataceae bacterium]
MSDPLLIEEFQHAGQLVRIYQDVMADNPRSDRDCAGTFCCWLRRWDLSDKGAPRDRDALAMALFELVPEEQQVALRGLPTTELLIRIQKLLPRLILLPVYFYEHGGLALSTNRGRFSAIDPGNWDSGVAGVIYCSPDRVEGEWGGDVEAARKCLEAEIQELDDYLHGKNYRFVVNPGSSLLQESCGGFIGDLDYVRNEAQAAAEGVASLDLPVTAVEVRVRLTLRHRPEQLNEALASLQASFESPFADVLKTEIIKEP